MTADVAPARAGHRPASLFDSMRAEWVKLVSLRSAWVTLILSVVLGVGLGALVAHFAANQYAAGNETQWYPADLSLQGLMIAQMPIAVLGCLVVTSEYSSGMVRTSLIATPRRGRFLAAKALVFAVVVLAVGELTSFLSFFAGQAAIGTEAPQAALHDSGVLRAVIGGGLYLALLGVLAAAIGALLRNTAASISILVGVIYVLPALILSLLPSSIANPISEWWPAGLDSAGVQVFFVHRFDNTLTPWGGFADLAAATAIVYTVALVLLIRRDA